MAGKQHGELDPGEARNELTAQVETLVRDAVRMVGFDLELLDVQQAGRRRLVKIVVDSDDGVGLDEVARASRAVAEALDAHDDVIAGAYTLEVTSPGVDRPLTMERHWRRAKLRLVKVRDAEGREFVGRVGRCDEHGVELLVDGRLRRVRYDSVQRAVVEIEFRQPPAEDMALLERGSAAAQDGDNHHGDNHGDNHKEEESR